MYIIKNKIDITKINKYLLSMNYLTEYYVFNISINTGMRITSVLNLKVDDILNNDNTIKNTICADKEYLITDYTKNLFKNALKKNMGDYLFLNDTNTNLYNRSQFYRRLKEVSRELNIDDSISNKSCEYTFAYHFLVETGEINYLCKIFNKSKGELISCLFSEKETLNFKLL